MPMAAAPVQPVMAMASTPIVMGISPDAAPAGPQDQVKLLDATTAGILGSVNDFTIKQRVKWWEALSLGCFEVKNTYDIFDAKTDTHLFIAQEQSDDCARCCCAPYHALRIEFFLVNSKDRLWKNARVEGSGFPVVMTLDRDGICNKPCICCFACSDSCKDAMVVHAGPQPVDTMGKHVITDQTIGHINQPACGGYCLPAFTVHDRMGLGADKTAFHSIVKMTGPCLFGGCSELCCESKFHYTTSLEVPTKTTGNLATLTKLKPKSFQGCARELFTDSDHFFVKYKEGVGLTPQQKASMMASIILADFHLFEQDAGMCSFDHNKITITLCDTYCLGCVCPCNIVLSGNEG